VVDGEGVALQESSLGITTTQQSFAASFNRFAKPVTVILTRSNTHDDLNSHFHNQHN